MDFISRTDNSRASTKKIFNIFKMKANIETLIKVIGFVMKKTTMEKDRNGKKTSGKSSQYIGRPH